MDLMDGQMGWDGRMDRFDGWMSGWMDWMDRMDLMDGWMDAMGCKDG